MLIKLIVNYIKVHCLFLILVYLEVQNMVVVKEEIVMIIGDFIILICYILINFFFLINI